jgi:hypothetical protein
MFNKGKVEIMLVLGLHIHTMYRVYTKCVQWRRKQTKLNINNVVAM